MCGICGLLTDEAIDVAATVRRMTSAIAHRGPDDEGYADLSFAPFEDQARGAFGFRRLAILDLSDAGHQPMIDARTGSCLVFNGEIYNFQSLRAELESQGTTFRGHSDSEVLLEALVTWGEDALNRLEGMFAFAWFDAPRRRVLLARDRHGIKPLYWTQRGAALAFASEIKALDVLPWLDRRLDVRAAISHVCLIGASGDLTMFRGVHRLRPGQLLTWSHGVGITLRRFDSPAYEQPPRIGTFRSAAAQCSAVLDAAIGRQLVADVQVGGFLSGGIDSSLLTAIAVQQLRPTQRYPTFTTLLEEVLNQRAEGFADDLPYAELVAARFDTPLARVAVTAAEIDDIDRMVWLLDEPIADPSAIHVSAICATARRLGVKVLLSGTGADDVFSGYRRHLALVTHGLLSWVPPIGRRIFGFFTDQLPQSMAFARRAARLMRDDDLPEEDRIVRAFMWLSSSTARSLLSPEAMEQLGDWKPEVELRETLAELPPETHRLNRMLYLEQRQFLANHNLIYTDKMSMAHGVEVRVPYLDDAVVRLAADIDPRFQHRCWAGKSVLREVARHRLPASIMHRPKTGFGANVRELFNGCFARRLEPLASGADPICGGLFMPQRVRDLAQLTRQGRVDAAYPLYAILCIDSWVRQFRGVLA